MSRTGIGDVSATLSTMAGVVGGVVDDDDHGLSSLDRLTNPTDQPKDVGCFIERWYDNCDLHRGLACSAEFHSRPGPIEIR
ncbi:hypothetical protein E3O06_04225 [Cryobacterium glaciale]|uniref:Uncharacterized protein n=1 Tax=Cryobacterium glaciale TaxID=1259145 RepID=A0A4R8V344_9MICO|nr:hypothetical protein [Cryobacterium glaciale]TFB75853.1 hypothetical protein E3O06_04225 [Cryobacterium glaciale]